MIFIEKLKVISLFSGIGAFEGGLERLGIDFELVGISEIEVYPLVAYAAIHCGLLDYEHLFDSEEDIDNKREHIRPLGLIKNNKPLDVDKLNVRELNSIYYSCILTKNLGDISEVESLLDYKDKVDLIVGGSPCQDFSIAGKQQGSIFKCLDCESEFNPLIVHHTKRDYCSKCNSTNLEKTRSSLLIEYLRTIREVRPKYFVYENVKNIVGKKFKKAFDMFNDELQEYGYNTYYQILNAKDYGIPQNRERIFVIGIKEDIDKGEFEFPKPFDSGLRLKDLLQDEVEEKYYINNDRVDELLSRLKDGKLGHYPNVGSEPLSSSALSSREHRASGWSESIGTLCARDYKDPKVIAEPAVVAERGRYNEDGKIEQQLEIQESGNANAITTVQKDNLVLEPSILRYERTEYGKEIRRQYEKGEIEEKIGNMRELKPRNDGVSNTLTTVQKDNLLLEPNELKFVGGIGEKDWVGDDKEYSRNYPQGNRVYDASGIACSQTAQGGGIGSVTGLYLEEKTPNELQLFTNLSGGKWDKIHESARRVYKEDGISPTVPTCGGGNIEPKVQTNYKIRKLTPLECWRLMDFSDEDYWKARKALESTYYNGRDRSNSQMYKMVGNSICVNVLVEIYKKLFKEYINE